MGGCAVSIAHCLQIDDGLDFVCIHGLRCSLNWKLSWYQNTKELNLCKCFVSTGGQCSAPISSHPACCYKNMYFAYCAGAGDFSCLLLRVYFAFKKLPAP